MWFIIAAVGPERLEAAVSKGHEPATGKSCGITCSLMQASLPMYTRLTAVLAYIVCKQEIIPPSVVWADNSTIIPPSTGIVLEPGPSILGWRGRIVSGLIPSCVRVSIGQSDTLAPVSMTEAVWYGVLGSLFVSVGRCKPSALYEGKWRLIVRDKFGMAGGFDWYHPKWLSWSMSVEQD